MDVKSLEIAVRDEIDAFVKNGCEFSAFSITSNIRHKVNNGSLEIDGIPKDNIDGMQTQNIEHQTIRAIVHQIFNRGDIESMGYERRWQNFPNQNSGYFAYGPSTQTNSQNSQVNSIHSDTTSQPINKNNVYSPASPSDPSVVKSVIDYFDHRFADGTPATLHSTQRRMKRTPLSITDIAQIAVSNGYQILQMTPYSESIVRPGTQTISAGTISNY